MIFENQWARGCAVLDGGEVRCWGLNQYGEIGDGTRERRETPVAVAGLPPARSVATSGSHTCAITERGENPPNLGLGKSEIVKMIRSRP